MKKWLLAILFSLIDSILLNRGVFANDLDTPLDLMNIQEAEQMRLAPDAQVINSVMRGTGPRIILEWPALIADTASQQIAETNSETQLTVLFSEKQQVDMSKFELEFRNDNRVLRLSERLRPYINENLLDVRHLRIPSGRFEVTIRIEDKKGHIAEKSYLWVVKN